MKQYLYSIVTVSVVCALFRTICPDGTSQKKFFSFLTSAVLLCATVLPVSSVIKQVRDGAGLTDALSEIETRDYGTVWKQILADRTKEETESAVAAHICEVFKLSKEDIVTVCTFSEDMGEGLSLSYIDITLYRGALLKNPRRLEAYVSETFCVPCTVSDGAILSGE